MSNFFKKYCLLKETKGDLPLVSKIKLQKEKDFSPFSVNKSSHTNLRDLIKAFDNSKNVKLGYTTIQKNKGEIEPQLKKKKIWLTGGAVRDHLSNKTIKNYDIVTDATPSEIRMILSDEEHDFTEVKPENFPKSNKSKYEDLPEDSDNKHFHASRWNKSGKEIEFQVHIKGQTFNVSTLSNAPKSKYLSPDENNAASSIEEDGMNRDLTFNSMYIPLNNSDGDNADLLDPFGGLSDLKNKRIVFINNNMSKRIEEDPHVIMRYASMLNRFGEKPDQGLINSISKMDNLRFDKKILHDEFLKGLSHPDVNTKKFLSTLYGLGIVKHLFPSSKFDSNIPEINRDKHLSLAHIYKNSEPEDAKQDLMSLGYKSTEAGDICHLVKLHNWAKNSYDPMMFYDLKHAPCGLSKNKLKNWMSLNGHDGNKFDNFINHDENDLDFDAKNDESMEYNPIYYPFHNRKPVGDEVEGIKRFLSTKKWQDNSL